MNQSNNLEIYINPIEALSYSDIMEIIEQNEKNNNSNYNNNDDEEYKPQYYFINKEKCGEIKSDTLELNNRSSEIINTIFTTNCISTFKYGSKILISLYENKLVEVLPQIDFLPNDMDNRLKIIQCFDNYKPIMEAYFINQKFIPHDRLLEIDRLMPDIDFIKVIDYTDQQLIDSLQYIIDLFDSKYHHQVSQYTQMMLDDEKELVEHRKGVELIQNQCKSILNKLFQCITNKLFKTITNDNATIIIKKFEFQLRCIFDHQLEENKIRENHYKEIKMNQERELKIQKDQGLKDREERKEFKSNEIKKNKEIAEKEKEIIIYKNEIKNEKIMKKEDEKKQREIDLKIKQQRKCLELEQLNTPSDRVKKLKEMQLEKDRRETQQRKLMDLKRKADDDAKKEIAKRYREYLGKPETEDKKKFFAENEKIIEQIRLESGNHLENVFNSRVSRELYQQKGIGSHVYNNFK